MVAVSAVFDRRPAGWVVSEKPSVHRRFHWWLERPLAVVEVPADRFARKIIGILAVCLMRSRRLNGNPFGGLVTTGPTLFADRICALLAHWESNRGS
jgi:hypothetical protein